MPELVPIRQEMFPELRDGILRQFNPNLPAEVWQRAFAGRGDADDPLGFALIDEGAIVGLLGTIFSRRQIDGREVRFCNLHTWFVRPEHRSSSLALMKPITALGDCTITDFSPTRDVQAISRRLGFVEIDRTAIILPPLAASRPAKGVQLIELDRDTPSDLDALCPAQRRIVHDHLDLDCGHLLVRDDKGHCLVVYSRIVHGWLPRLLVSCLVHHVSDPGCFARHHAAIRAHLLRRSRSRCVVVDSRLLAGVSVPGSFRVPAIPKICRSTTGLPPAKIDGLYSDQAYFKLSTLPTLATLLKITTQSLIPFGRRAGTPSDR